MILDNIERDLENRKINNDFEAQKDTQEQFQSKLANSKIQAG